MLRPYQRESVEAVYRHLRERDDHPVVVLPTGAGKSWVIARIAADATQRWNGRVLVLAHRRELIGQNADKLRRLDERLDVGLYSAGLKRKDRSAPVLVAGIQSIWKKACDFDPFDLVLVDECHLIDPGEDGMYATFLKEASVVNPRLRIVGFTATAFRMRTGPICTPEGFLNHVCYEVGVRELIVQGYLCPLVTKAGKVKADTSGLHVRAGEFVPGEVEALMDDAELVRAACAEVVEATRERNACLIFASGVKHGEHIVSVLKAKHDIDCGFVTGDTPVEERDATLARFKAGKLKYLCNVNVLTTGFDAPHIDCVALLRPTLSPGLYYQMVGRGFRLHPSKVNCLVLDFGGNVLRHGPVDQIRIKERSLGVGEAPAKECPECNALIAAGYAVCPECGYEFPPPDRAKHAAKAGDAGILSGQVTVETLPVRDVMFSVHTKRGAGDDAPKSLRVDYKIGWHRWKSEWVCLEHDGFARQKAVAWWKKRSHHPVPATAAEAVEIANAGGLASTKSITVRSIVGEEFDTIVGYQLNEIPTVVSQNVVLRGEASLGEAGHGTMRHGVGSFSEIASDEGDPLDFPFGYNVAANDERSCQATTKEEIPF